LHAVNAVPVGGVVGGGVVGGGVVGGGVVGGGVVGGGVVGGGVVGGGVGAAATVSARAPVTLSFSESDSTTLKVYVPAFVGVPVTSPLELIENPCGSEDCPKLQEYGGCPPLPARATV
jgi:hypothetical protein